MRRVGAALLIALATATATAHPHPGGLVVRPDGTVVAGDILNRRLLLIAPRGAVDEVRDLGDVRGLALATDGTLYAATWGRNGGVWKFGGDGRPALILGGFNGLVAAGAQDSLLLSPVDAHGRGQGLDVRAPDGRRSRLAGLADITAVAAQAGTVGVAAGSSVYVIGAHGEVRALATDLGHGHRGLTVSRRGVVVADHAARRVVELGYDGTRRELLAAEAPWAPTDVALHDGALYVLELAEHPCCWKGPRVRRQVDGQPATILLAVDDGRHLHVSPGERPLTWLVGTATVGVLAFGVAWVRRKRRGGGDAGAPT